MILRKIGEVDLDRILLELESKNLLTHMRTDLQKQCADEYRTPNTANPQEAADYDFTDLVYDLPYVNSIIQKYHLSRTRVLGIQRSVCYSYHKDSMPRVHIPLITNDKCMFIVDDQVMRMPADGSVYWLDTMQMHTALNANLDEFNRFHIVGNMTSYYFNPKNSSTFE